MLGQFHPRGVQAAEIDDSAHPGLAGGVDDVLGRATLLGGEVLGEPHRVNEVVHDVDVVESRLE